LCNVVLRVATTLFGETTGSEALIPVVRHKPPSVGGLALLPVSFFVFKPPIPVFILASNCLHLARVWLADTRVTTQKTKLTLWMLLLGGTTLCAQSSLELESKSVFFVVPGSSGLLTQDEYVSRYRTNNSVQASNAIEVSVMHFNDTAIVADQRKKTSPRDKPKPTARWSRFPSCLPGRFLTPHLARSPLRTWPKSGKPWPSSVSGKPRVRPARPAPSFVGLSPKPCLGRWRARPMAGSSSPSSR